MTGQGDGGPVEKHTTQPVELMEGTGFCVGEGDERSKTGCGGWD